MVEGPQVPRGVHDLGQWRLGDTEDLQQLRIPLRRAELRPRCRRGIGGETGAESVAKERVHGSEPRGASLDRLRYFVVVLQKPGELASREVRVEGHPAALPDLLRSPLGLEPIQHLLGALVLPRHDRGERPPALGVPRQYRFPLVVESARSDLRRVGDELGDRTNHSLDDDLGVLLDPARLRMRQRLLPPRLLHRLEICVEENGLYRGSSLVDSNKVAQFESPQNPEKSP